MYSEGERGRQVHGGHVLGGHVLGGQVGGGTGAAAGGVDAAAARPEQGAAGAAVQQLTFGAGGAPAKGGLLSRRHVQAWPSVTCWHSSK